MDIVIGIVVTVAVLAVVLLLAKRRPPQLPPEVPARDAPKPTAPAAPAAAKEASTPPPEEAPSAAPAPPPPAAAASVQVEIVEPPPATPVAPVEDQSVSALRKGLASTRGGFIARLAKLFSRGKSIDIALLEEIEEVLISADIGVKTSERVLARLREQMQGGALHDEDSVWAALRAMAASVLSLPARPLALQNRPAVILVIGVNGAGKTTTIGKLAARLAGQGKKVLLAAGDTYRAAAVLQLEVWGKRVGCPVTKGKEGADPGSVIFEALRRAQDEAFDVVIADTAGRLHTKTPLMEELKKVDRTIQKALGGRGADEILLVLDATTGQNAVQQMHMFREALQISGVVLTKLDGTAKGGMILSIVDEHKVPVRFVGLGEKVEDLREFDASAFVEALFAKPDGETLAA